MNFEPAPGMGKKARFSEPVHANPDAHPGCSCHRGECFLADLRDCSIGRTFRAEMSAREQNPSQSLFAGTEEMID
jgi:hypothetical protein